MLTKRNVATPIYEQDEAMIEAAILSINNSHMIMISRRSTILSQLKLSKMRQMRLCVKYVPLVMSVFVEPGFAGNRSLFIPLTFESV